MSLVLDSSIALAWTFSDETTDAVKRLFYFLHEPVFMIVTSRGTFIEDSGIGT